MNAHDERAVQDDGATLSRRGFLKGSACAYAALAVGGVAAVAASGEATRAFAEEEEAPFLSEQYGFMVDMDRCVGCKKCVEACRKANHLAETGTPDRRTVREVRDSRGQKAYISTSCMHCGDPNCMRVCPAGAISKGSAGIVSVDSNACIGCKYCFEACPYEVPRYDSNGMDKCDCCLGAGVTPGDEPYCARACKFGALKFGQLSELVREAKGRAVRISDKGHPSVLVVQKDN